MNHLEFLSLKGGCTCSFESTLVKCHIVENHMSRLIHVLATHLLDKNGLVHDISVLMASASSEGSGESAPKSELAYTKYGCR